MTAALMSIGSRLGRFTVLDGPRRRGSMTVWLTGCECGSPPLWRQQHSLVHGTIRSCRRCMQRLRVRPEGEAPPLPPSLSCNEIASAIARRLHRMRTAAGYSRKALSVAADLTGGSVGAIELRRWLPGLQTLIRLADVLCVTVVALLADDDARARPVRRHMACQCDIREVLRRRVRAVAAQQQVSLNELRRRAGTAAHRATHTECSLPSSWTLYRIACALGVDLIDIVSAIDDARYPDLRLAPPPPKVEREDVFDVRLEVHLRKQLHELRTVRVRATSIETAERAAREQLAAELIEAGYRRDRMRFEMVGLAGRREARS